MVYITKTNQRDERKQVSDAITSTDTNVATNTTAIAALDTRITSLEGGVNGTPPTALYGRATTNAQKQTNVRGSVDDAAIKVTASSSTYNSWFEVVGQAATNPGILNFLTVYQNTGGNAANLDAGARLTIDSVVVWSTDNNFWQASTDDDDGAYIVGGSIETGGSDLPLAFNESWSLECRINENSAGTFEAGAMAEWSI